MPKNHLLNLSTSEIELIIELAVHAACSMQDQTPEFVKRKNELEAKLLLILERAEVQ
jgi:hypothetical protein